MHSEPHGDNAGTHGVCDTSEYHRMGVAKNPLGSLVSYGFPPVTSGSQ